MLQSIEDNNVLRSEETGLIINPPPRKPTLVGRYNPVVSATLHGNRMRTCQDVRKIYSECLHTHSTDSICKTAASYFTICMNGGQE